jgi:hypothetical protein
MNKFLHFACMAATSATLVATVAACEDTLDSLWKNPNEYTPDSKEVCSGLFTHLQQSKMFIKDYGEAYHLFTGFQQRFPFFIQLAMASPPVKTTDYTTPETEGTLDNFFNNYGNHNAYVVTPNNIPTTRFTWFYTEMNNYGLIRDEVGVLEKTSPTDYNDNVIYLHLATVLKDIVALQTVDLFNHIPYTDAFKGSAGVFFVSYDDPEKIYAAAINSFQTIADLLPGVYANMSDASKKVFARQDMFFKGDVDKWVRYINGETLRACIRISGVSVEGVDVNAMVAKVKDNLIDQDYTAPQKIDNNITPVTTSSDAGAVLYLRGLNEVFGSLGIPNIILKRMKSNGTQDLWNSANDDPRLPIIAMGFTPDSGRTTTFHGISMDWTKNFADVSSKTWRNVWPQNAADVKDVNTIDRAADAAHKGLGGVSGADNHIKNAVQHSIDFWYSMNRSPLNNASAYSPWAKAILQPENPANYSTYADKVAADFNAASDKMEIIMQQKYIHLNILEPYELFAEIRRTGHPKLEPVTWNGANVKSPTKGKMMMQRIKYPEAERTTNKEAYDKWNHEDNWTSKIFWAPERAEADYFMNDILP